MSVHLLTSHVLSTLTGAAAYEKAEDPLFVLEHSIPIDTHYYLENQLSKPLMRIFEPILGSRSGSLLSGEHTRTVQQVTSSVGALMRFTVKTAQCLGCRTALPKAMGQFPVCNNCRPNLAAIYEQRLRTQDHLEMEFARLWTCCQRCQGSVTQDVICTNNDCPIFFKRYVQYAFGNWV